MCFAMAGFVRSQEVPASPDSPETIRSQAVSADLQRLAERIERRIEQNHPDWRLERIIPIVPSENVIIDQWQFGDKAIRMSVVPHRSASEAREAIQDFARYMRGFEEVRDLGEGGYWFGANGADLTFIKGRITVYVTIATGLDADLRFAQTREADSRSEKRILVRGFADHVAGELDSQ